jgi:type VI secretion system secreted protein VgrG
MSKTQPVRIKTPLADDLVFRALHGEEELGRCFTYELDLLSPKEDLALDDVLGHEACVELDLPSGGTRYFHGYVTRFAQSGRSGSYVTYTAELKPWPWFLTRTADCRIFQQKSVPDIVKAVFREHGFSDFKDLLSGSYSALEYCVQYRETDFDFVSRLLEQEGIYYYFKHEQGKHTLVLADSYGGHAPLDGYKEIEYFPPSDNAARPEHIYDWQHGKSVQPGRYVLRSFDFKKPKVTLESDSAVSREHAQSSYAWYDYPGDYYERGAGDAYARVRMQEVAAQHARARGLTDARGVATGGLFTLKQFPRKDQNREYLVVSSRQSVTLGSYESGSDEGLQFECTFEAMDSQTPFRAACVTPKPVVKGPQTAIVVGKSGEEIWTDEFGRVKVQFHWDRYGKSDENSSCWVRVAQVWAGGKWGGMHIPRMGQEVVIEFLEGDPDQPIITGRVYNADNLPPYALPDDKTQSGLKSRSSKGASPDNFNEIRFEDKKGDEELYIHAEKNQTVVVENDQTITVGGSKKDPGNRSIAVHNDETLDVGHDRAATIGNDKRERVGRNKTVQVGADHAESIGANMTISVGSSLTESVAVNYAGSVGAAMELSVGGAMAESVGLNKTQSVGNTKDVSIGKTYSLTVGKDMMSVVADNFTQEVGKNYELKVSGDAKETVTKKLATKAKAIQITADDEITLKTGSAQIVMKKNGDITIKGKKIEIKGSGDVIVKGSKVQAN